MASQYGGIAPNISSPPLEVSITSSTNATPISVTTSSAHGVNTGDLVFIYGHLVNTNANGIRRATRVSDTVLTLDGIAGNGVGVATGTTVSMACGASFQLPDDGDTFNAAAWNVACEALADRTAFLWEHMGWALNILKGGNLQITAGATLGITGNIVHPEPRRPTDAATITVDATAGYDTVILPTPASNRIVVVQSTSNAYTLTDGMRLEIILPPGLADGLYYTIKRQDGTIIAKLYAWTAVGALPGPADATGQPSSVVVNVEGGVWRGLNSTGVTVVGAGW